MSSASAVCPECGAALAPGQAQCWLCHRPIDSQEKVNPYAAPRPLGEHAAVQFSLETLFLVTTLVAVCLGVVLIAPGAGVLLAIIAVPALARSFLFGYRSKQAGARLTTGDKIGAFVVSFFLMLAVGWAGCIAFFAVCLGTGLAGLAIGGDDSVIAMALGAGTIAGLAVVGWLFWLTRPHRHIGPREVHR